MAGRQAYGLSGCGEDDKCVTPSDLSGYVIERETNLGMNAFMVTARCADFYHTAGRVGAVVCTESRGEYTLTGCREDVCKKPSDTSAYVGAPAQITRGGFSADPIACADTYQGVGAAAVCSAHNAPYTLSGCSRCPRVAAFDLGFFSDDHLFSTYCCSLGAAANTLSENSYGTNYEEPPTLSSSDADACPISDGRRCVSSRNYGA
eukprot:COSAG01_NODE_16770_length_1206_cov_0.969286_1_plen_204_part_10